VLYVAIKKRADKKRKVKAVERATTRKLKK
jgi:hypothetical protein